MSVGKLTGKVEKKAEGGRRKAEPSPLIPNPLYPLPLPLFIVRTPTATVTDLGTEFGVEVSSEGDTEAQVFVGKVQIATAGGQAAATGKRG